MINRTRGLLCLLALAASALMVAGCAGGAVAPASWPGLTVKNGTAYLAATDSAVALATTDGAVRWTFKSETTQPGLFGSSTHVIPVHAAPAVSERGVYIGSDGLSRNEGRVRALSLDSGQVDWQFPAEGQPPIGSIFAGLVVSDSTLYFGVEDHVYALNTQTDTPVWDVAVDGRVWGTPCLAGDRLYVSTLAHKLFALDVTNKGNVAWTFDQARGALAGSPVVEGDTVYVGSFDNRLYALDRRTGQPRWRYDAHNWIWDGLTVVSGTVYVGDLGGYVQALDAQTGRPRWSAPVQVAGAVRANPLYVPGGEGLLIAVTDRGNVYGLDAGNGSVRWAAVAPASRLLTPPFLEGDTLLLATLEGPVRLYGVNLAALPGAYQQQAVTAGGRAPVVLYKENAVNPDVVRWSYPPPVQAPASKESK